MTPDEELNKVLTYLNHNLKRPDDFINIQNGLNMKNQYTELDLILRKLVKDEYVEQSPLTQGGKPIVGGNDSVYLITYDGRIFLENGGYIKQRINDTRKMLNIRLINFALIFGGVAAGAYYTGIILHWVFANIFCH